MTTKHKLTAGGNSDNETLSKIQNKKALGQMNSGVRHDPNRLWQPLILNTFLGEAKHH